MSTENDFPIGESVGTSEHSGVDLHQYKQAQQQAGDEWPYVVPYNQLVRYKQIMKIVSAHFNRIHNPTGKDTVFS